MRASGKRKPITQEMINDLSRISDQDFMKKWDTSRQYPIRVRKRLNIKSFNNQYGLKEHKFENGEEFKWCSSGHWENIKEFYTHSNRWDGLRSVCKSHEKQYPSNNKGRKPWNTRKHNSKRKEIFISWEQSDETRVYTLCNNSCAYCKTPIAFADVEFDHFIPVKCGGYTEPKNMLPSCSQCNRGRGGKFNKDPYQWLMTKFGAFYGEQIYLECCSILEKIK